VILTQSQTIDDLNAACSALAELRAAEVERAAVILTQSQTIDDLTAACATLQNAHAPLLAELCAAQVELAKLRDSTSWRLTQPLRSLRQRLRPA
jgi:hypothetical protein